MHNRGAEFSQGWIEESRNNRIMLAIGGSFAYVFLPDRIILDFTLVTVSSLVFIFKSLLYNRIKNHKVILINFFFRLNHWCLVYY